jgi:tetratricopeptide (TPR) repeat protein
MLTADDLDLIGQSALDAEDPFPIATELIAAVDGDRIEDKADISYALCLAAEIHERQGELEAAQALTERAVEATHLHGDPDDLHPRAYNGQLLLLLGREDEGMAALTALRPRMSEHPDAALSVGDALEEAGRPELAIEWLTEAVETVLQRIEADEPEDEEGHHAAMVYGLLQQRHRLRHDLDLPHDRYDDLATKLDSAVDHELGHDDVAAMLFWPRPEFDELINRWPALTTEYGEDWDDHRASVETEMVAAAEAGYPRIVVLTGSIKDLAAQGDPTDLDVRTDYEDGLDESHETAWPPGRNEPCWCGSGQKYKKCCRPRSRT